MNKKSTADDDYATTRVPMTARFSFMTVTLIRIGQWTSLSQFMLGAMLGHAMTFEQAMLATVLGSLLLEFLSFGLGLAGAREGLSISLLSRWCGFGRCGSALIGIMIAISLLGWFGIQNAILANSLDYALNKRLGFGWSAALAGITLTLLVALGFRALNWTAKVSVPLFSLVIGWISLELMQNHNMSDLMTSVPTGVALSLGAAVTAVTGGCMTGAFTTPDISRYCQNGRHVFWMTVISIIVGEFIVNGIAILIAHALNTSDVVTIMGQTAGWIGLLTVILSAVKINDINLYSSTLGIASAVEGVTGKKWRYTWLTILLGITGTTLSVMGILEQFTPFLILLGVVFPPIIGVMLVDYYILRTSRALLDTTRITETLPAAGSTPWVNWLAIAAWIIGSLVGLTVEWGIPSLNSLLVASVFYWITGSVKKICHDKNQ
ncbi:cytosine permease [Candidatus Regiella endosymbiont of Tuberolachnus salignus]|uniref:purine-cytosine permease family protein n=1 Tax=Candidatus Regiella endosymbiont of Tuberolachnus salignus TaxID=3077956 RepID=UPI0030CF8D84